MPAATRAGGRASSPSCPSGPKLHSRLAGEQPAWPPPPQPTGRPQRASLRPPRPSQVKPPPRARWSEARSLLQLEPGPRQQLDLVQAENVVGSRGHEGGDDRLLVGFAAQDPGRLLAQVLVAPTG